MWKISGKSATENLVLPKEGQRPTLRRFGTRAIDLPSFLPPSRTSAASRPSSLIGPRINPLQASDRDDLFESGVRDGRGGEGDKRGGNGSIEGRAGLRRLNWTDNVRREDIAGRFIALHPPIGLSLFHRIIWKLRYHAQWSHPRVQGRGYGWFVNFWSDDNASVQAIADVASV